jgi:hypothetical protein
MTCEEHNHQFGDVRSHAQARKLNAEEQSMVKQPSEAQVAPKPILDVLRSSGNDMSNAIVVYNYRPKCRMEDANGRSPMYFLLESLKEHSCPFLLQTDDSGATTALVFTTQESLKMLSLFRFTVILDCSQKTTRFKMPLMHVVGMDCFGKQRFQSGLQLIQMKQSQCTVGPLRLL